MIRRLIAVCAGVLLSVGAASAAQPAAAPLLSYDAYHNMVTVREPQISPDGVSVVYVRSRADFKHDRYDSELVIVPVAGGAPRVLTRGKTRVSAPRWSPDATRIAYLAAPEEKKPPQVFVLAMNGGDSQQVTHAKQGVLSFAWRPDGKALAYVAEDAPDEKALAHHLDAVEITDEDYLTEKAPLPAHLWIVDADGLNSRRLNSGTWSIVKTSEPVWSPDGSRIYYQRQPDAVFAHFVQQTTYAHDIASGSDYQVLQGVTSNPKVSPDGKLLAVAVPRHGSLFMQNDVHVRTLSGAEVFSSLSLDRNVHWFGFMPEHHAVAIAGADGVRHALWILGASRSPVRVDLGDVDFAPDASIAKDGGIAFVGERRDRFEDIYYLAAGGRAPKQLTDENAWLAPYALGRSTEIRWPLDNGMTADGVLTYPSNYVAGQKYPLVLDIHGGPIETSTWNMSGLEGGMIAQLLAAKGYLVLRPNYRGSDNSGDAYVQAIVGDVTSGPGKDNLAGVQAVRRLGIVDASRIFVSGWSGGGLQTSWLIGHAHFWRAAVSGAAVNDWYQQALLADISEPFASALFGGTLPFTPKGRAEYRAESPITYASQVVTPTLILSDTRDQRVPVSQAYTFYHALRDRGVPVKFTAFPRYGHFPPDPVGRERALQAWIGWIERWSK